MYNLEPMSRITVTHAFYRPEILANPDVERHVFNGGLLFGSLAVGVQHGARYDHEIKTHEDMIRCAQELWSITLKPNSMEMLEREHSNPHTSPDG
jgi:hypothetical protein